MLQCFTNVWCYLNEPVFPKIKRVLIETLHSNSVPFYVKAVSKTLLMQYLDFIGLFYNFTLHSTTKVIWHSPGFIVETPNDSLEIGLLCSFKLNPN